MTSNRDIDRPYLACPWLGLEGDPESHALFATPAHRCFLEKKQIKPAHQEAFCISSQFAACPMLVSRLTAEQPRSAKQKPTPAPATVPVKSL